MVAVAEEDVVAEVRQLTPYLTRKSSMTSTIGFIEPLLDMGSRRGDLGS